MSIIRTDKKNVYAQASELLAIVQNTYFEKLWNINMPCLMGPDAFYIG